FSRTTQSEKIFVRKDVSAILEAVKNDFREIVDEKLAIIETEGTLHEASVIPFQFHQLLYNLIGNALKFSDPERPPHIIPTLSSYNFCLIFNLALVPGDMNEKFLNDLFNC